MHEAVNIHRTVEVKLSTERKALEALERTIDQYRWAGNFVVDELWCGGREEPEALSREEIHDRTYDAVRAKTDLHSAHVQLARDRAIEALDSFRELRERGKNPGKPEFTAEFLDFNVRSATVQEGYATLATVDGRHRVEFVLPDNHQTPHHRYLLNDDFELARSTLVRRDGDYFLNLGQKATVETPTWSKQWVLGVDLGISNLAVTSTGRFWSGDRITHWRDQYSQQRRSLQKRGSRWAHENLQSISKRVKGRIQQYLHTVANELVKEAQNRKCRIIVFENLSGIFEPVQRWQNMRSWAYRTLIEYVTYKSKPVGIKIVEVDPEYTSQRCSTCGYTDPANRTRQDQFECQKCGYQNHADYNGAKNVGLAYLRRSQNGCDGGAPAGVRTNSGIITEEGYQSIEAGTESDPC